MCAFFGSSGLGLGLRHSSFAGSFVIGFMDDPPSRVVGESAFRMRRLSSSDVVGADGDQDSGLDRA